MAAGDTCLSDDSIWCRKLHFDLCSYRHACSKLQEGENSPLLPVTGQFSAPSLRLNSSQTVSQHLRPETQICNITPKTFQVLPYAFFLLIRHGQMTDQNAETLRSQRKTSWLFQCTCGCLPPNKLSENILMPIANGVRYLSVLSQLPMDIWLHSSISLAGLVTVSLLSQY